MKKQKKEVIHGGKKMDTIERYRRYQKGRYVKMTKQTTKFFKLLDRMDKVTRDEMLLLDSETGRENNILMCIGFLVYAFVGGFIGYVIGLSHSFTGLL